MRIIYGEDLIKEPEDSGTTFYEITPKDLEDAYDDDDNIVMKYIVRNYGFDAFDLDNFDVWGSRKEGRNFILCVSDGYDIDIDGEEVDPMDILENYDLEALAPYFEEPTEEVIKRYFSSYELKDLDIDEIALELLNAGHHLTTIISDMELIDML